MCFHESRRRTSPWNGGFEGSWAGESDNEEYDIEKEIWG